MSREGGRGRGGNKYIMQDRTWVEQDVHIMSIQAFRTIDRISNTTAIKVLEYRFEQIRYTVALSRHSPL